MIKKFFIVVLVFCYFFGSKVDASAVVFFNTYSSTAGTVITSTGGVSYTVANYAGNCAGAFQTCNKGSSSSDCGTGFCSSGDGGCCSGSGNWTKNKSMCVKRTGYTGGYTIGWGVYATQCSLADKQIGSEPGLRAGYCTCGSYSASIYKYCCTAAGNPEQPILSSSDNDGQYPPEKDCPGGYAIDGNRVRSSPCTGPAPTPVPTSPPGCTPNCGDTNSQCSGVVYGNGCGGSCTGTNGGGCGDTNSQCWGVAYTGSCGKACTGTAISWDSCFNCNEKTYWTMYSDVKDAGMHPYSHYDLYGRNEGRIWQDPYCDGSTLFNCGSTTGKNCGDTNAYCSGTPYGSASGCGSCTGTRPTSTCSDSGSHCVKDGVYFNNGCGTCTGTIPTSNCSDSGSHCVKDGIYFNNGCGTCTGTLTANCSATSANYCTYQTFTSTNGCGTCTGTKTSVVGTNGSCGGSNGGSFTVASPPTALCNAGTASGVSFSGTTYSWSCFGTAGICAASGTNTPCSATRDLPPTFSSIVVKNSSNTTVAAETGNVNQICQNEFNEVRTVNVTITAADPNGAGTIGDIQLRWNGINFTRTGLANGVATFTHTFAAGENTTGATDFQYYISDGVNATGWQTAGRSLKVWNCNVSTTGRLYDGGASGNCSVSEDYLTPATATNFKTLDFTDSPTMNMNRVSESEYNGNLTWGKGYTSIFNTDLAMQINGGGVRINTTICPGSIAFTLNNAIVNPYSTSPSLRVDFSGVVDQDSWYQTLGGGLMANSKITNRVPVTCTTNCAMAINNGINTNGIVASPTINNTGNSGINKGNPNNWWVTKPLVSTSKSDYTYFLNQYFWKGGIGTTLNGDKNLSDIGATGVVFINGNLTINANNSVPVGSFLMMVSNGNITVQSNVTNLEGIFVSKNFNVGGSNATALAVKGMIKATNSLQINRTFVNKRDNNINPAVNFVYRPDFVFHMPNEITKQLVKWQWGN